MIKNTIFKKFVMPLVCLMMLVGLSAPVLAFNSISKELEDNSSAIGSHSNDTIATAENSLILIPNNTSNTSYVNGTIKDTTDTDYYEFLYQKAQSSNGRFAIKLEGIKSGNSYYLYLVDKNNNIILSSKRSGNQNQIIRVPVNTLVDKTKYYIRIEPTTVATPSAGYTLFFEDNFKTVTGATYGLLPSNLNSYNGQRSVPALVDLKNINKDPNATVLSASVSAVKGSANNGMNYIMSVAPGTKYQQNQWYTANWNSEVTSLKNAGVLLKDSWYVAFQATSFISGVNVVSITSPKLTFTYEYDSTYGY